MVSAYRRHPNLQDILVRADLGPVFRDPRPNGVRRWARNPTTGTRFPIPHGITLKHANCVYLIQCRRCQRQYVGETGKTLLTRLTQHRYNISTGRKADTHLVQHFREHGVASLWLRGLEHDPTWTAPQRRRKEAQWIVRLGFIYPGGLNAARGP